MKKKELKFKIVGGIVAPNDRSQTTWFKLKTASQLSEEQIPEQVEEIPEQNISQRKEGQRFKSIFQDSDPRKSRFIYCKVVMIEKLLCLLTSIIFLLSCAKTEADILWGTPDQDSSLYLMNALSVCTLGLILALILRQMGVYQLELSQNKAYRPKHCNQCQILTFLRYSGKVWSLLIQIMIFLPHPVTLLTGRTFTLFQTQNQIYLNHSWNDLLSILLAAKVLIIYRALLTLTDYASPRASRLCHQNGLEHNQLYIIKCLIHQHPLSTIAVTFTILIAVSSYCLKLAEGVLFLYNAQLTTGFQTYANCVWSTFITMSTVGYGDFYPKTLIGRAIMLIAAIFGVFLSSILIVSLSMYLQMIPSETKSHLVLNRLEEQKGLMEEASRAVVETVKIKKLMGQLEGDPKERLEQEFTKLKEKVEGVKTRIKQIKSMVACNDLMQEMNRLFYILKDNLKDIYRNQLQLKRQIYNISEIDKINLSFRKEVSEMFIRHSYSSFTSHPSRTATNKIQLTSQHKSQDSEQ